MTVLVVTPGYPDTDDLYTCGFVHARALGYRARGFQVEVFVLAGAAQFRTWEGVPVIHGSIADLTARLDASPPDCLALHFADRRVLDILDRRPYPTVIWVHGAEALRWDHRPLDWRAQPPTPRRIARNIRLLRRFGRFIRGRSEDASVRYVFPSEWMRRMAWADCRAESSHAHVIANPIDDDHFAYRPKTADHRRRLLLIRPFSTRKYANDIAVDALLRLGSALTRFEVTWYGDGPQYERVLASLLNDPTAAAQVRLVRDFLTRDEIAAAHREHGIFLCPTRQDAQGVSMCEAMSSGLVPIASPNTAIPEFVEHGESGLLCASPAAIADAVLDLEQHPDRFLALSKGAAAHVRRVASADGVIARDLAVFKEAIAAGGAAIR